MKKVIAKPNDSLEIQKYTQFLEQIKLDILQTQIKAACAITTELIMLYWRIGKGLSEKIQHEGWGAKVEETLAQDLKKLFPSLSGFSRRNLFYMRKFAEIYHDSNCAAAAAQIPWGHNMVLLDKLQSIDQMLWYVQQTLQNGWSRSVLEMWIESNLYNRQGKAVTNFKQNLPQVDTDLAEQLLKDPYNFNFLTIEYAAREQEIENGLIEHIEKFLIELGQGFAFVGRQFKVTIGKGDFFIDLLFYHYKLRCFFVIELKSTEFDARDVGQINMYLAAIDNQIKHPQDNPTIGLILCKSKDKFQAEYALQNVKTPIGIADYTTMLTEALPTEFKGKLPTIEEIEAELEKQNIMQKAESKEVIKKLALKKK